MGMFINYMKPMSTVEEKGHLVHLTTKAVTYSSRAKIKVNSHLFQAGCLHAVYRQTNQKTTKQAGVTLK